MERWLNKIAVVTGANSGVGSAITKDLIRAGLIVIGLDLNCDNLEVRLCVVVCSRKNVYFFIILNN